MSLAGIRMTIVDWDSATEGCTLAALAAGAGRAAASKPSNQGAPLAGAGVLAATGAAGTPAGARTGFCSSSGGQENQRPAHHDQPPPVLRTPVTLTLLCKLYSAANPFSEVAPKESAQITEFRNAASSLCVYALHLQHADVRFEGAKQEKSGEHNCDMTKAYI